ncbi:MAG: hypothetical protein KAG64_07895 [Bacteroidales bacterium]|nr:hypothetical protein [Bacteroidales bacterium]
MMYFYGKYSLFPVIKTGFLLLSRTMDSASLHPWKTIERSFAMSLNSTAKPRVYL